MSTWYSDSSGNSNSTTPTNASWLDLGGGSSVAKFEGAGFIELILDSTINYGDFTIEAFVKFDNFTSSVSTIVSQLQDDSGFSFYVSNSGILSFAAIAGSAPIIVSSAPLSVGVWYHVAVVRTGGAAISLFTNGALVGSGVLNTNLSFPILWIGGNVFGQFSTSEMSCLRISNAARYSGSYSIPSTAATTDGTTAALLNFFATAIPAGAGFGDADTWGSTHNGQYQASGRWYFNSSYVGASQGEYDIARADYWGLSHNGQFENQSRWYFDGTLAGTSRAEYRVVVADSWGLTGDGQYGDSGRYYYGGVYVGGHIEYIDALALDGTRTGLVLSGRYYYCGNYVGDYNAYVAAANTWGETNDGGYGLDCDPLADRYYHNGILVHSGAIMDPQDRDTAAMYLALADAWGTTHNGQFLNSGRWYFNGGYVGDSEIVYWATFGTYWGTVLNGEGQWQSSDVWYHDGALVGAVADYADFWGLTHNGQFESCGRWYFDGVYVGGATEYFELENGPRHPYTHGSYYSDDQILVDGVSILYTGKYNNTLAASVSFSEGLYNVTTNGSGVVTLVVSANWYDDTSSAHHAVTLNGGVTQVNEGSGVKVASFDGSTGSLSTTLTNNLGTDDFTIEAFIYPTNTGFNPQIMQLGGYYDGILWRAFEASGNEVYVQGSTYSASQGIQLNTWNHVALTRQSQGNVNVFVNGVLKYGVVVGGDGNLITNELVIGSEIPEEANSQGPFEGKMVGVRIVKGTALYTSNFTVPTTLPTAVSGTQLLLNFGATAAPTVELPWYGDLSSAHHAVTLNGSPIQGDEGGGVKVANFDGGTGYLTSPASADFNLTGDFTIEFFVYANDANDYWELIQLGDGITTGRYSGWGVRKETAGNSGFAFSRHTESGGLELNLLYSFTPIANEWLHVAVTRDSSAGVRFFVNGTQLTSVIEDAGSVEASKTISFTNPNNAADMPLTVGAAYFGDPNTIKYFNGRIAGLRIIKGTALYTSSFSVPTTLPTAVSGTQLLLNFGATAVPTVTLNDTFTDASIDGSYNITPYSYTTHAGRFYVDGVPYTGTHSVTDYQVVDNGYGPEGYTTSTRDIWFVVGTEVNVSGSLPSVSYADGVYTITGSVNINSRNLTSLNFADCVVTGNFSCGSNQLTSLQGAPSSVGGNFDCYSNQLTSLQHAPATVGGNFECFGNQLTSLQYGPTTVGGDYNCYINQLTSLQYAPSSVGNFDCRNNQLTSLQYAPTTVSGSFHCHNNQLTSLQYAPTTVGGSFSCRNNQLTSLQYAPSSVGSYFDCRDNLLTSLQYAPSSVATAFHCSNNQFSFPIISQDIDNVYWEYASNDTRKLATNHHYIHSSYYADVAVLVSGTTVLYTASDSNTTANNVIFYTATNTITTNGSGVATVTVGVPLNHSKIVNYAGGAESRALVSDSAVHDFGTNNFTIEVWLKQTSRPFQYNRGFGFGPDQAHTNSNNTSFALNQGHASWSSDHYSFELYNGSGGFESSVSNSAITLNAWTHLAVVRNGTSLLLFVNGQAQSSSTLTLAAERTFNSFGAVSFSFGYFTGKMTNARVIKNQALYTSTFTPPNAPLTLTGYGSTSQGITGTVAFLGLQTPNLESTMTGLNLTDSTDSPF